jgi:FKBP-type peptidyl-prolyl cis-trans isomerase
MRRYLAPTLRVGTALALAGLLAACSSSSTASAPVQDPTFGASSSAATSASSSAAAPAAPASTAPAGVTDAPGVPAVSGGTDLTKEPKVAAGTDAPSGLVVRDLVVGTGTTVDTTATVNLKYVGALFTNGTVFDASWAKSPGDAASFALSGVIPGFAQGLVGMKVGGRREIVIPPALGYGASATGSIPANSTLVFVCDMVSTSG